jgi:hypothetical protein
VVEQPVQERLAEEDADHGEVEVAVAEPDVASENVVRPADVLETRGWAAAGPGQARR